MGARLRVSPWVLSEAGRLLRSGMAQLEVAVAVGIGLSTLQRYLTNDDVAMFQERKRRSDALTLGHEQAAIRTLIDSILLRHQARKLAS